VFNVLSDTWGSTFYINEECQGLKGQRQRARGGGSRTYVVLLLVVLVVLLLIVLLVVVVLLLLVLLLLVLLLLVLLLLVLLLLILLLILLLVLLVVVVIVVIVALGHNRANGWEKDEEERGGVSELHGERCVQCRSTAMMPGQAKKKIVSEDWEGGIWEKLTSICETSRCLLG
jgi:membrane protein implicated in regulation of membrane protease activity